jgi:hypothetical protein
MGGLSTGLTKKRMKVSLFQGLRNRKRQFGFCILRVLKITKSKLKVASRDMQSNQVKLNGWMTLSILPSTMVPVLLLILLLWIINWLWATPLQKPLLLPKNRRSFTCHIPTDLRDMAKLMHSANSWRISEIELASPSFYTETDHGARSICWYF